MVAVVMVSRVKLIESHVRLKVCEATDSNFFAGDVQIITIPEKSRRPAENAKATAEHAGHSLSWEGAAQVAGVVLTVASARCDHLE